MKIERDAAIQDKNNLLRHMEFLKNSQRNSELEKQFLVRFQGFAAQPVRIKTSKSHRERNLTLTQKIFNQQNF